MNPHVKVGDRIRLIEMPNDPDPVPAGSLATVTYVLCEDQDDPKHMDQIQVDWDNGRTLNLAPEVDRYVLAEHTIEEDFDVSLLQPLG